VVSGHPSGKIHFFTLEILHFLQGNFLTTRIFKNLKIHRNKVAEGRPWRTAAVARVMDFFLGPIG